MFSFTSIKNILFLIFSIMIIHEINLSADKGGEVDQIISDKVHIVVALPYKADAALDSGLWYTEDYVSYINTLVPSDQYDVTGYFVSLHNIPEFVRDVEHLYHKEKNILVLNFCDGGEWDGYPGVSVIKEWENHPISELVPISGGDSEFIFNSDNKSKMNILLKKANLKTFPELLVHANKAKSLDYNNVLKKHELDKHWPLFCKLNMGWGASGIGSESICHNVEELRTQMLKMNVSFPNSDIIIQPFLEGPEYTVLVLKDQVYASVRRDYNNPYNVMFEDYLSGVRPPEEEVIYSNAPDHVGQIALDAIQAIPGNHHYTRVDLREDAQGNTYVLDINDRPGFGENSTIKYMLQQNNLSPDQLLQEIVNTCRKFK